MAYILLYYIITNYRMPQKIILNKDKLFILKFWKSLTDIIGIK